MSSFDPSIPNILPHQKMYNLQIGDKLFVVSGASLSSDAPSYFTNYFLNDANKDKVLFIDRSPDVFHLINLHLQGYHIEIQNGDEFTKLYLDAIYYNLPRLKESLLNTENYYVTVGNSNFKVSKRLVDQPGNTPNLFSVAAQTLYYDIAQLMKDRDWIRPPPQAPVTINRSAGLFQDLLSLLQGFDIDMRSDVHRRSLIKEAKYYRFNKLASQLVKTKLIYNIKHQKNLVVSLQDLNKKSLIMLPKPDPTIYFYRESVDAHPIPLVMQIDSSGLIYSIGARQLVVFGEISTPLKHLFDHLSNLPEEPVKPSNQVLEIEVVQDSHLNADITIDGEAYDPKKQHDHGQLTVLKSLWKFYNYRDTNKIMARPIKLIAVQDEKSLHRYGCEFI